MPKKVRPGSKRLPPWQTPQTQCRGSYSRKMSKKVVFEQAKDTFSQGIACATAGLRRRFAARVWRDYYKHVDARRRYANPTDEGLAAQQRDRQIEEESRRATSFAKMETGATSSSIGHLVFRAISSPPSNID